MYRGTTPTITINCDIDASEFVTMWVTFRVQKRSTYGQPQEVEITKRLEDEGVDVDGQVISITLTQADTLLLGSLDPETDQTVQPDPEGRADLTVSVDFKAKFSGSAETFSATMSEAPAGMTASMKETGGGTASNYQTLRNKPRINGVELSGDLTAEELGITSDQHYTHKQAQAAKVWTITHGLGKRPSVTVVDSAGTAVIGEIEYLDDNTVRLTFCAAFSGTAYCN